MDRFKLDDYVRGDFDGMLVIGDVHSNLTAFERAVTVAKSENYFLLSLGDLVDRGDHPFEVVSAMHSLIMDGRAGFVIGNHDDKFRRFIDGNKVQMSKSAKMTLDTVGEERMTEFLEKYHKIVTDPIMSGIFHKFDDLLFAHAASHPAMWENPTDIGKTARSRALVGETNGETDDDGYPVRLYNWVEEIPMGKTVVVGHDHMPITGKPINEPLTVSNKNGGKAVFMDTGCGKGGHLSAMLVSIHKHKFKVDSFMEFK